MVQVGQVEHLEVDGQVKAADLDSLATTYLATTHPLYDAMLAATLIGAVAGVSYFGLLGLLLGPLALSYFFELLRMYRDEYVTPETSAGGDPPPVPPVDSPASEPEPA